MLRDFTKSMTRFAWALTVFGVSQSGYILRGLPTRDPTLKATQGFDEATEALKREFDAIDQRTFRTGDAVQGALVDLTFNLLQPQNYNPRTLWQTGQNLARWGAGIAAQFVPGGRVGTGGPPVGWGPVNTDDAELFWVSGGISSYDQRQPQVQNTGQNTGQSGGQNFNNRGGR